MAKKATKPKVRKPKRGKPVVVTTKFRGVFFGYMCKDDGEVVTLTDARNCLFWSRDVRGFLGLAAAGPTASCRIGPAAPSLTLRGVTALVACSAAAAKAWEAAPWS